MPEGHSVHRLARQFRDVFRGAELAVSSPQGKFSAGAARLDGHTLERADAHGKQLFLAFSHDLVLRVHLGLYGAWDFGGDATFTGASSIGAPRRIGEQELGGASQPDGDTASRYAGPPEPRGAVRVRLVSAHGWADLRGPTACEVLTPAEAAASRAKLGPDPLHNLPGDREEFIRRLRASGTGLGVLLMKQDILAGVGNVYRAEALFRRGLDPLRPGRSLPPQEAAALWDDIAAIMRDGVRDGRIITTLPADLASGPGVAAGVGTGRGRPNRDVPVADAHYVYKRNGLPCRRCGTEIALREVAGRKLYWCPGCQRPGCQQ
ncbi:Fpg/Nei family DNA glycosylase [Specibacter sp. RAF43]|uniref:Fpg/Nei family DNA glycosylase n=1 Tax=Specibacter sp. RAF43 TaxID=3233057 RepID=UPI003F9D279B